MPLWSQGFKVCIHPPLTDESRIALNVGDCVNVTRWRRHWLFGEKIQDEITKASIVKNGKKKQENEDKKQVKLRTRGWFPRQCAAEFFEDIDDNSDDEIDDDRQKKKMK